jgi:hypothetical protein
MHPNRTFPLMISPLRVARGIAILAATAAIAACHRTAPAPANAGTAAGAVNADPLRPLPTALYGAQLPDRLDDSTFWRTVTELSEPGGYFQSENFVSNEMGLQYVIAQLETLTPPGGAYVGVGPEQNFTYIGALRPRVAFVIDIRRQNLLQHLWYKAVFELSPTRAQFLARLFARPGVRSAPASLSADSLITVLDASPADPALFRSTFAEVRAHLTKRHGFTLDSSDLETLHYVDSIFFASGPTLNYSSGSGGRGRGGFNRMPTFAQIAITTDPRGINRGFLGNEEQYGYVRDLERRNLVIPIVGDFAGPKAVRAVGAWLRQHGTRVGVFYTSNVEQYLFQPFDDTKWSRFYESVGTMPLDSTSRFIRSSTGSRGFGGGGFGGGNGFMMQQLTSSIVEVVNNSAAGRIRGYADVLGMSRP